MTRNITVSNAFHKGINYALYMRCKYLHLLLKHLPQESKRLLVDRLEAIAADFKATKPDGEVDHAARTDYINMYQERCKLLLEDFNELYAYQVPSALAPSIFQRVIDVHLPLPIKKEPL